jgi:hypothetical protein
LFDFFGRDVAHFQAEGNVVKNVQVREKPIVLEDQAKVAEVRRCLGEVNVV